MAAQHQVMSIDPAAAFMIISDMDDTVIHTGITDLLMAARLTFLNNARTRKPLAGVAALYRALEKGCDGAARNPFFYVSNSGWNMYDLLKAFIELNDIPQGPLFLRDLGLNPAQRDSSNHKAHTIQMFLKKFPELPAVLIGDSGQHDAALYATIADTFPGRILAIYIRDVDPDHDLPHDAKVDAIFESHANSGLPMLRAGDSPAFARHMQRIGLLPRSVHQSIAAGVERDNNRD